MTDDLVLVLILSALALGFASLLVYIRLRSLGLTGRRILGLLAELWLSFAAIITLFSLTRQLLGEAPRTGLFSELAYLLERVQTLPPAQQWLLLGALVVAIGLFAHLLWSLRAAFSAADRSSAYSDGDTHD